VLNFSSHVIFAIGYSSQVFSTKSLALQFGDGSVTVMACFLSYSPNVSLILKTLACV